MDFRNLIERNSRIMSSVLMNVSDRLSGSPNMSPRDFLAGAILVAEALRSAPNVNEFNTWLGTLRDRVQQVRNPNDAENLKREIDERIEVLGAMLDASNRVAFLEGLVAAENGSWHERPAILSTLSA